MLLGYLLSHLNRVLQEKVTSLLVSRSKFFQRRVAVQELELEELLLQELSMLSVQVEPLFGFFLYNLIS